MLRSWSVYMGILVQRRFSNGLAPRAFHPTTSLAKDRHGAKYLQRVTKHFRLLYKRKRFLSSMSYQLHLIKLFRPCSHALLPIEALSL